MPSASSECYEDKNGPVFIGGMERSGTSMFRAVVGSHPDIAFYEWDHKFWFHNFPARAHEWQRVPNQQLMRKMLHDIFSSKKYTGLTHKPDLSRVYNILNKSNLDAIQSYIVFAGKIFDVFMEQYRLLRNRKRWGFKSPWNEFYADIFFELYPNCKFLHIYRNVLSVSSSMRKIGWMKTEPTSIIRHTLKWNKSIELILSNTKKYPGRYLGINYDHFVLEPEIYTRFICAFLNISYEPQMLGMSGHPGWKGSNSSFETSSTVISPKPAQKPVDNLSENEFGIINILTQAYTSLIKEKWPDFSMAWMDADCLNSLAGHFYSEGKVELATEVLEKAIKIDPSYEFAFENLGKLCWIKNDSAGAVKCFSRVLQLNPDNRSTATNMEHVLTQSGRISEAQRLHPKQVGQSCKQEGVFG